MAFQMPVYSLTAWVVMGLLGHMASAAEIAPATYVAANIVPNIDEDCPVRNVPFDEDVFSADSLLTMPDVLSRGNVSQECQSAAVNDLVFCFSDGSLQIMTGCCSTVCSNATRKNIKSGCFAQYVQAICNDPKAAAVQTGLFNAAKRCANYDAVCATTANNTTKTAAASANTTTAGMPANSTDSTAASRNISSDALPETPAANTTVLQTVQVTTERPTSDAEDRAMSTILTFVGAIATFVLAIIL